MCDNGSQPTSLGFMKACSNLVVHQAFTSYNNPKGNADTERMIRTMKEELFWLREWESERELSQELDKWVDYYNSSYLHSAHDTARRFRLERSITKIMLHIYTQFDMGDDLFVSYVVNLYKQLTYMLSDEIIRAS